MGNEFAVAAATTSAVIAGIASIFVMVISDSYVYVTDVSNTQEFPFNACLTTSINIVNPPLISTMQRQRHARDGTYNSGRH